MDITNQKFITTGVFFLFILLSGFWVSRSGKPYNGLIFNIHKLIGLAAGIYLVRMVYLTNQAVPLSATQWAAIIVTVLLFGFTVAAGGLMSMLAEGGLQNMGAAMQMSVSLVHKYAPYLIVLSTGVALYLLLYQA